MTLNQALDNFLFTKRLSGVNENSIHTYRANIRLMLRFLDPNLPIEKLTFEMFSKYVLYILDLPISRATQSSYVRNNKIFLCWVHDEYGLSFDPRKIKVPKSPKKNVHIYSNTELRYLFKMIDTTSSVSWIVARNRSIVAFMLDSGLRQLEVCGLRKADIDRERMIVKITGKGAKDRLVPIGATSLQLMDNYLAICPYTDLDTVFCDRRGNVLSGNAIRLFVYRLERKLPFELSSHKLRHNFATNYCVDHLEKTGKSHVYDLSIILGHESIETTKRYEHFAHELVAVKNSISHLDMCLGNGLEYT